MNTYDFDKTIFYPDSTMCFYFFCLRRWPAAVLPTLPKSVLTALRYRRGVQSAKELKKLQKEQRKREKELEKEAKRKAKEAAKEAKRKQKEAEKEAKRRAKEAKENS